MQILPLLSVSSHLSTSVMPSLASWAQEWMLPCLEVLRKVFSHSYSRKNNWIETRKPQTSLSLWLHSVFFAVPKQACFLASTFSPHLLNWFSSVQFTSVTQSCLTLCDPMNHSTPDLPVHHQLPEFTQTHVHQVSDAIQPSHPLSSPSPPALNPSQHPSLFQWVNSLHEVATLLEFQL